MLFKFMSALEERKRIQAIINRRIEEADLKITQAPTLRDGGRQAAALRGRFSALVDLLRELDPSEPDRLPTQDTEDFHRIAERESGR